MGINDHSIVQLVHRLRSPYFDNKGQIEVNRKFKNYRDECIVGHSSFVYTITRLPEEGQKDKKITEFRVRYPVGRRELTYSVRRFPVEDENSHTLLTDPEFHISIIENMETGKVSSVSKNGIYLPEEEEPYHQPYLDQLSGELLKRIEESGLEAAIIVKAEEMPFFDPTISEDDKEDLNLKLDPQDTALDFAGDKCYLTSDDGARIELSEEEANFFANNSRVSYLAQAAADSPDRRSPPD